MKGIHKRSQQLRQAISIQSYANLEAFVEAFASGHLNLIILVGAPGLAKSRSVRRALSDACWIEGNASPFGMYLRLFEARDRFIVVDDVDSLHSDKNGVRLLKCLCQTEDEKTVAWPSAARQLKKEGVPREFTTTSRVVIISNDWKTLNRNVSAVEDRGHTIHFEPNAHEVHAKTGEWFADAEIYDWFGGNLHRIVQPSMRLYYRAQELKASGLDWRVLTPLAPEDQRKRLASELLIDESFRTQEARAQEFIRRGGGCRATFFNHVRKLRPAGRAT